MTKYIESYEEVKDLRIGTVIYCKDSYLESFMGDDGYSVGVVLPSSIEESDLEKIKENFYKATVKAYNSPLMESIRQDWKGYCWLDEEPEKSQMSVKTRNQQKGNEDVFTYLPEDKNLLSMIANVPEMRAAAERFALKLEYDIGYSIDSILEKYK